MSEQEPNQTDGKQVEQQETRTFSQEQVNAIIASEKRQLAEKYADYDDLKAKVTEAEDSAKTEQQRLQEQLEQSRKDLESERVSRLRAEVAAEKGVLPEALSGGNREEMEAVADRLLSWREQASGSGNFNPSGGFYSGSTTRNSGDALTPKQQAAAALREMRKQQ